MAAVAPSRSSGLALSGSGTLSPIEFGSPQVPPISLPPMPPASRSTSAPEPLQKVAAAPTVAAPAPMVAATRWTVPSNAGVGSIWGDDSATADEGFIARMRERFGLGRKRKGEDDMAVIAIPLAIGLTVFVGAMAMRRRRKPEDPRSRVR